MKKIFLFVAALCCSAAMWAADFSAEVASGQTLYFNITDNENLKCEVTYGDGSYTSTISGDVTIPAEVEYNAKTYTVVGIGGHAFQNCGSITSLTLPTAPTFTTIGTGNWNDWCFRGTNFESFVIPDNVTSFIAGQAFRDAGLKNITFGSGIPTIPTDAFFGCSYLKHVVFPNSVTTFNNGEIFAGTGVKYVELGNAVTSVNANTFGSKQYTYSPTNIDTIVIHTVTPPTVVTDEYNYPTFYGELTNRCLVFVPSEAVAAYKLADHWKNFKYIYAIGTVLVTNTLTVSYDRGDNLERAQVYINDAAMSNGATFKGIEGETFNVRITYENKYYGINKVMLGETDVTDQFDAENKATLTCNGDATLSITHRQIAHPYDFTEVIPSGQTLYFKIIDAVNHKVAICNQTGGRSSDGSVSAAYDGTVTEPEGDLVIPTSITHSAVEYTVEEIDTLAFRACTGITSVVIPEGIRAIRASAFRAMNIGSGTELVIPESCTRIEYAAFRDDNFNAVNPGGAQVIEQYAFLNNPLTEIKASSATQELHGDLCQKSTLTTVGLGENVEFVSSEAFSSCSGIETVTVLATTPPDVKYGIGSINEATSWGDFDPSGKTLYVPKSDGSTVLALYQAANCWKLFGTIAEIPDTPTALDNTEAAAKAVKRIVNGQLFIERDGKTFNAQGVEVK